MPSAGHFKIFKDNLQIQNGFPGGSAGKESACNAGDLGSIPGLGRSPGEGNGNPLQYSCLENSLNRRAWQAIVYPDAGKEWRQEDKVTTEDEKVGWHAWLSGHESEQALGVDDRQGSLACCSPWVRKDMTERWNWTELQIQRDSFQSFFFFLLESKFLLTFFKQFREIIFSARDKRVNKDTIELAPLTRGKGALEEQEKGNIYFFA